MPPPTLLSVQVGRPQVRGPGGPGDPDGRPWTTGFWKTPVAGPVMLRATNLDGDGQADLENHGGVDKAVCAYPARHYDAWRREPGLADLPFGGFGENFTVGEIDEATVCVGDLWRVGGALVEVSQPRQPCGKLARRWGLNDLPTRVIADGRTGWYFRVRVEGEVAPGAELTLLERPFPAWTVGRANLVMHRRTGGAPLAAELAAVPPLAESWKAVLRRRAGGAG